MADHNVHGVTGAGKVSKSAVNRQMRKELAKEKLQQISIRLEATQDDMKEAADYAIFNPLAQREKFKKLEEHKTGKHLEEAQRHRESKDESARAERLAKEMQAKNPEMNSNTLLSVLSRLGRGDSAEEILRKVREAYPDVSQADDALEFLIDVNHTDPALKQETELAKSMFNEMFGRDIRAGKNMAEQAREFSKQGLGSPNALRDLYRDIVANPRDPHTLFDELTGAFEYKQMKAVIDFVLHSLGADLKAKGPSIPRGELERLFTESRVMQAFLGLFKFFQKRMPMIDDLFDAEDLTLPASITFQTLAKVLMQFLKERYPSTDKVRRLSLQLGISQELAAQIIIFSMYRDALRNISPRLFKNERHRQDIMMAILELLADLEDEIDEEEEL